MLLTTYKDFEINVDIAGRFTTKGIYGDFDTLQKLFEQIDKEAAVKYKPIAGFVMNLGGYFAKDELTPCTITRPHGHESRDTFWIKYEDGKRETSCNVFADTPENREKATEARRLMKMSNQYATQSRAIVATMRGNIVLEQVTKKSD